MKFILFLVSLEMAVALPSNYRLEARRAGEHHELARVVVPTTAATGVLPTGVFPTGNLKTRSVKFDYDHRLM